MVAATSADRDGGRETTLGPAVDLDALRRELPELRERYRSATPFPHIAVDGFLLPEVARVAVTEVPPVDREHWTNYVHANERKFANTDPTTWGPTLQTVWQELTSPEFLAILSELTGIADLVPDPALEGAGLHQTKSGGFLNIHADFTVHPRKRHWHRRANLLVYLNEDWPAAYGGDLELWSRDMTTREQVIAPIANRAVIFTTGADTWHGHPDPLRCPPDRARQSLAIYYYTVEDAPVARSTEYRARPGDGAKAIVIWLDKESVRVYDWVKRRVGLSDERTGRLLRRFRGKGPSED
ncbi:MAG: 2OG-Fe(II) oxygenase [Acidimicrobiales bacterium]|jgi:hypothetical protein